MRFAGAVYGFFILLAISSNAESQDGCTQEGAVELIGLGVSYAGIVRVCVKGFWGTVCTESETQPWSEKNSQVACRRAGFAGAVNPILQSTLSTISKVQVLNDKIHYTRVSCNGYEKFLSNCSHSTVVPSSCTHNYDAAVTCKPYSDDGAVPGDVRLLGDVRDGNGAVEYYDPRLGGWTGICVDSQDSNSWFTNIDAAVIVCRQLGYDGGSPSIIRSVPSTAIPHKNIGEFSCSRALHFNLSGCESDLAFGCDSSTTAGGVQCTRNESADYTMRLRGGDGNSGVVEVAINGRWGTICGDLDLENARTVCSILGLPDPHQAISNQYRQYHGLYDKPSWFGSVDCAGKDIKNISTCSLSTPIGYTSCSGSSDLSAEVSCVLMEEEGLSGGEIAGIVIGSLVGVGILGFLLRLAIENDKKKKAAALARAQAEQRQQAANQGQVQTAQQSQNEVSVQQNTVTPAQQPPAPAESEPPAEEPTPHPDSQLASAAPPSYSAAVGYPVASGPPTYASEKPGAYPPAKSDAPYPTSIGFYDDAAYPPAPSAPSLADFPAPTNSAYPPHINTRF